MTLPLATRDDLEEMALELDQRLDRLDAARSVSPDAELRRLETRETVLRWLRAVRDRLGEMDACEALAEALR